MRDQLGVHHGSPSSDYPYPQLELKLNSHKAGMSLVLYKMLKGMSLTSRLM